MNKRKDIMKGNKKIIELKNVSFAYEDTEALEDVTFSVSEKDFFGIIGPNGGGKTTILKLILGLINPSSGKVLVLGTRPREARKMVGYVPQFASFDFGFPIKVRDVVLTGRLNKAPLLLGYSSDDKEAAERTLADLQISNLAERRLSSLSGGERQRVLIARALVSSPSLLLLDEPTASVDIGAEESIYELLKKINKHVTIILVSHDIGFVTSYVNLVACINRRLVCHPTAKITTEDISKMYHEPVRMIHHHKKL